MLPFVKILSPLNVCVTLAQGRISTSEMSQTFNCGIGFILVTGSKYASTVVDSLREAGEPHAAVIGSVVHLNTGMYNGFTHLVI